MILLRTKLLLSSVTFVRVPSTHFRFFHCTHNQLTAILFFWKHTLYGTKLHLTFHRFTNHNAFRHAVLLFFSASYVICFGVCLCVCVCLCLYCVCLRVWLRVWLCLLCSVFFLSFAWYIACFPSRRSAQTDMGGRRLLYSWLLLFDVLTALLKYLNLQGAACLARLKRLQLI